MRRLWLLVPLAALLALAAGCGGDGGGGRLTKEELITQADAICREYDAKIEAEARNLPQVDPTAANTSDEDLRKFGEGIPKIVGIARDQVSELRDLSPPEDFEAGYEETMDELDEAIDELDEAGEAMRDLDRDGVKSHLAASEAKSDEADERAREYGFKECGSED